MSSELETTNNSSDQESILDDHYNEIKAIEMEGYELGIKKARNSLFVVAGLLLVGEIIGISRSGLSINQLPGWFWLYLFLEIGAFIGLALWTYKKPYVAILIGLILFIAIWIYSIIENGLQGAIGGIIVKIIIITYLVNSLKDAKALEDARKEVL